MRVKSGTTVVPWLRSITRNPAEQGSVTAELAVVLPAVMLCLVLVFAFADAAVRQMMAQDGASILARADSRGESLSEAKRSLAEQIPGFRVHLFHNADLACAKVTSLRHIGGFLPLTVEAASCVRDLGR